MKTTVKLPTQTIAISGILLISLLYFNTGIYAYAPSKFLRAKSNSEKIDKEVSKIKTYLELLKNSDEKKEAAIQWRIQHAQGKIHELVARESEMNVIKHSAKPLPYSVYDFDASDNSLSVDKFRARRTESLNSFNLSFETPHPGVARVDIISPGGELLQSLTKSNFGGSLNEEVALSAEKGKIYFVHINVDDKGTTKKLVFK